MLNKLIVQAEEEYGEELKIALADLEQKISRLRVKAIEMHPNIPRGTDELDSGTISIQDARLLYILVRILKPKNVFEIGTWIGTSSMAMAEAMRRNNNGGHIYTCDINCFYALDDSYGNMVTTINTYSDKALKELPSNIKIDFVFADGELTFATIKRLKQKLSVKAIIATHDFELPAEKGVLNLLRMQIFSFCNYSYILPQENDYKRFNSGVLALLYKDKYKQSIFKRYLLTIRFLVITVIVKMYRKLLRSGQNILNRLEYFF